MATKTIERTIPQPSGKPVVGNAFTLDTEAPLQGMMALTREQGPIFQLDILGKPLIVVSGAELARELFDEKRFDKAVRGPLRKVRVIGGDALFTGYTQEANWSKAHNILLPTFSQRAMVNYLPMMIDVADQLVQKWERLNADDEIDVVHDMTAVALDTVGICGFGYRFNSFYRQDFHPYIDALGRTLETCMVQRGLPFEHVMLRKRLEQLANDADYMNSLVDDIIRERRRSGDRSHNDLLNYMIEGVDKTTGESLSDENIRYQINTFLIAGHETTSGLMAFTLCFLLNHPDVLEKAYAEVDRVLGRDIAVAPTYAQVNQLEYIRMILFESLRLWPTAPAIGFYPYKDEMLGGKYPIKKNQFVTMLTLMLHRDKSVWGENAESFDPENFSKEAERERPAWAYKPFGNGQRACIGRQFAIQEAILVMGMILQRFQLVDHNNYELKIKETLSIKPDNFKMKVRLRPDLTRSALVPVGEVAEADGEAPENAQRPKHGTKLYVLYGSNLGTTEAFARDISQSGELNGFDTVLAPLDDFANGLPTDGGVVIASASYNGAAPDNAVRFIEWLENANPGDADGVQYTVFGCGNRDWAATYQDVPRLIDERLEQLGAKRIVSRGEADAREDLDGQFHEWFDPLWQSVGEALGLQVDFGAKIQAQPLYDVEVAESVTGNPVANQAGAMPMRIVDNQELQNRGGDHPSPRSTRHIEVELPEGVSYEPGDHLCVVPVNHNELVKRLLNRFGFDEDSHVRINVTGGRRSPFPNNSTFSVKRLADVFGELQAVASRKDVGILAEHTRCPDTKRKLEALAAPASGDTDLYRTEVFLKRKSVSDLLEEFPACELPFAVFLEITQWMSPRYYSISSSPSANSRTCSVTVGVVEGPARSGNGIYRGVCSNYLANARPGDVIQAVVKPPSAKFRLPEDASQPMIMVGPGTGLAPFRGFIQERRALKDKGVTLGQAMLFFGCRRSDEDFIYADELKAAHDEGLIDLHTAFSRESPDRIYVQDVIRSQGAAVWTLLEEGAAIYVCGDGAAMEPEVKRALTTLYAQNKDVDFEVANNWMESMSKEGRYVLDVWAGG
ncbi:MAG: cytochrome P450 [Pseudomonadota bacterium]